MEAESSRKRLRPVALLLGGRRLTPKHSNPCGPRCTGHICGVRRRLGGAQPARGAADEHADPFFRLPSQVSGRLPDAGPKSKGFEHRSNRRDWRPADCCDQMRLLGLWQPQRGVSEGSGGHRRDHASGGGGLGRRLAFVQARLDLRGAALRLELEGPPITIAYPLLHLRWAHERPSDVRPRAARPRSGARATSGGGGAGSFWRASAHLTALITWTETEAWDQRVALVGSAAASARKPASQPDAQEVDHR